MVVTDAWLLLLIFCDFLPWCFCWCYPPPLTSSSVLARLLFSLMDDRWRVIAGRLIYPRGRLGVDWRSGIGVGRPGLWFREVQDYDSVIFCEVDVRWSLKNVDGPDASRLNTMVKKASIWSYVKIWLVGGVCLATAGIRRKCGNCDINQIMWLPSSRSLTAKN